jgi:hypothetical protein
VHRRFAAAAGVSKVPLRRAEIGETVTTLDLRAAYRSELDAGYASLKSGDFAEAFRRFERAHILGQRRTRLHVRAHVAMLRVAWTRRDKRELAGQSARIVAAALFSRIWVPEGNTGGANVSALKPMPVPEDLQRILRQNQPRA